MIQKGLRQHHKRMHDSGFKFAKSNDACNSESPLEAWRIYAIQAKCGAQALLI